MSYGQKSHVAIAFQNSWDTSNVASLYHMQYLEESVGLDIPPLIDESNKGIFDEGDSYAGPKVVTGDLSINVKPIPLGVLLRGICGAASVVDSAPYYVHTFKPRTTDFGTLSAGDPLTYFKYMDDGGSGMLFYNLNMTTLELGASNGEFLTAKGGFVGGAFSQIADIAASYPVGNRLPWDASSIQLGGSAVGALRAVTITMDEQLEAMHTLNNSKFPSRVKRTGARTIEVAGTVIFDDQVEYQKFIAQTEEELIVSFAVTSDQLVVTMPAFRYSEFKPVAGGAGKIEVGFTGSAKYHATSATAIQFDLGNLQAVY